MMLLRWLPLLLLTSTLAPAGEVRFERVWPGYRTTESFTRIGEYFGGRERHPGQTIHRSQPAERAGYYWLVRTHTDRALAGARFILEIVPADGTAIRRHEFPADVPAGSHASLLGLTGRDWPGPDRRPTAWRLRLLDASGHPLADEPSFLWREHPEDRP
jgi:hypothetical protein